MNTHVITMRAVSKSFGSGQTLRVVLRHVDVRFQQGHTYAITGASGSGKSTLIHVLAGVDSPSTGSVLFDDRDLSLLTPCDRSLFLGKNIGLVFQSPYLIAELSVQENVMLPGLIAGLQRAQVTRKAQELLAQVGLADRGHDKPSDLSGGQQQRVALARALVNEPAFLLADEPTGNLDVATGIQMMELMLECQREWGMGIIVTSHDPYVAKAMGSVFQLNDGLLQASSRAQ